MLSLDSLAGWEEAVLASVDGACGTLEERDQQIERSGLYGEYPAIVRAYTELFADPPSALEAVKRAVFLVWRDAMELPVNSGIASLPEGTVREVVESLDALARRDAADAELAWMLAWYHDSAPFLLELYGATPALLRFAGRESPQAWRLVRITPKSMQIRGQMGRYWLGFAQGL